jgi:hypothetical protein
VGFSGEGGSVVKDGGILGLLGDDGVDDGLHGSTTNSKV